VKTNLAHGQFAQAFFVFTCEMHTKIIDGLIGNRENTPRVTACGEDTSGFEHGKREICDGVVRQGVIACNGDSLNFT